jgi:hypothetical protein
MRWKACAVVCLVLAAGLGGQAFSQTQISFNGTNYASNDMKVLPIDKDHLVMVGEQMGIEVNDKPLFNNLSTHFSLIVYVDKEGARFHGYGTYADKDGDKMVWEIWDFPAGADKGKGKLIGATGKFAGMEGTATFVNEHPRAWPESSGRLICREVFNLVLKNPM